MHSLCRYPNSRVGHTVASHGQLSLRAVRRPCHVLPMGSKASTVESDGNYPQRALGRLGRTRVRHRRRHRLLLRVSLQSLRSARREEQRLPLALPRALRVDHVLCTARRSHGQCSHASAVPSGEESHGCSASLLARFAGDGRRFKAGHRTTRDAQSSCATAQVPTGSIYHRLPHTLEFASATAGIRRIYLFPLQSQFIGSTRSSTNDPLLSL